MAAALIVVYSTFAHAGQLEDGLAAANRGDGKSAISLLRPLAERGDASAQFTLGAIFETGGPGISQDVVEAARWYRQAAEQGNRDAEDIVGLEYAMGQGVAEDPTEATRWFRKAAEQGQAHAQLMLGLAYADGVGVPRDVAMAATWYRQAAEQGNPDAAYNLGYLYAKGHGVPVDNVEAFKWWTVAETFGFAKVRERAIKNLELLRSRMRPEQIAEGAKRAREWKRKPIKAP